MTKKNDKRMCWNCEGGVSHHLPQCPYCGVDVTQPPPRGDNTLFKGFASPFQSASQGGIPQPPYAAAASPEFSVSEAEWKSTLNEESPAKPAEDAPPSSKKEIMAFLLLLPGIVFLLFGLVLILFSTEGVLTLQWNQDVAYFYFIGAVPFILLGWRAFR